MQRLNQSTNENESKEPKMENPWDTVTDEARYAKIDKESLNNLTNELSGDKALHLELYPEPFIGDPSSARLIFMATNPGYREPKIENEESGDIAAFEDPETKAAIRASLSGESRRMYWVDLPSKIKVKVPLPDGSIEERTMFSSPRAWYFAEKDSRGKRIGKGAFDRLLSLISYKGDSIAEARHRFEHSSKASSSCEPLSTAYTGKLIGFLEREDLLDYDRGKEIFATRVAVVDFFPYHSETAGDAIKKMDAVPSQKYAQQLMEEGLEAGAYAFVSRAYKRCAENDPLLRKLLRKHRDRILSTSDGQNVAMTPSNMCLIPELYDEEDPKKPRSAKELYWEMVEHLFAP